jgi:CHASE2 domain-containing sensor protein/predicted Ser/Thr protein kinase
MVGMGQGDMLPVVPHTHIVKELGSGRFGVVYKAWWLKDRPRLVALKCLSFGGETERERFDREIKVLKQIDSPHIVKCLDSGVTGGTRYFVMDLIQGVHLDEYLETSTSSLDEKLALFQRVCGAVAEAHAKGVVHRDLKPRNILIDHAGDPHILDFGICTLETGDWSSSACQTITRFGDIIGTLKYMSPEQAWGGVSGPIDERSDVWSLGVMLYEIVTGGDYPYDLRSTADKPAHEALLDRLRKEMPTLPRLRSIERGRQLEILLERCLAWEPNRRLNSAAQLAEDTGRYRAKQRIKTKPLSAPHRIHRLAVGIATKSRWAALIGLVATLAISLWVMAFAFDVRWRATGYAYGGDRSVAASAPQGSAADSILLAGISDATINAVVDFARENNIEGVSHEIKSIRAVHGHLMERLASAKPRAVVWDYYFRTPQPGDPAFVGGVERLAEAGVPVVLGVHDYDADGTPELSPHITAALGDRIHHGSVLTRHTVRREGEFLMAIQHPSGEVSPSLSLATLAAVLHPDAQVDIDWSGREPRFDLLYETEPGSYLRVRDRIELTKVFSQRRPQFSVTTEDVVGCKTFELRRPAQWAARTVPYEDLLTCSPDQLRAYVENRVLVFGDLRLARAGFFADRREVRYGGTIVKDVPGCYLMCDAIAGLLDRRYMKSAFPLARATFLLMLLLAVAGGLLPVGVALRPALEPLRVRRLLWLGLGAVFASCFVVMISAESYRAVHLGMAGVSLLMPMCGSFWVEFARGRHRILDRERRSVESLGLDADRTVTMPRWRPRTLPAEQ